MSTEQLIAERRSIRKYTAEEITEADLTAILEAGRMAPSAKNRQPWKFIVYRGEAKKALEEAMELGIEEQQKSIIMPEKFKRGLVSARNTLKIMREAPVLVLVLNTNSKSPFGPVLAGKRINEILDSLSIGAAIENMLLAARERGIGSLWIGNTFHAYGPLVKAVGESAGVKKYQIAGAVSFGYADETPAGRPRKTFEEIVEYRS